MNRDETILLINKVLSGSINDFDSIIEFYKKMVFGIVSVRIPSKDVEDVAQDIFVDVFKSLGKYSQKGSFSAWIRCICMRRCCDYWRKHEKQKNDLSIDNSDSESNCFDWLLQESSNDLYKKSQDKNAAKETVEYVMNHLKTDDRLLLDMIYFQNMKLREAAETLDWGLAKCKVRVMRLKKKMRQIIEMHLGEQK